MNVEWHKKHKFPKKGSEEKKNDGEKSTRRTAIVGREEDEK